MVYNVNHKDLIKCLRDLWSTLPPQQFLLASWLCLKIHFFIILVTKEINIIQHKYLIVVATLHVPSSSDPTYNGQYKS